MVLHFSTASKITLGLSSVTRQTTACALPQTYQLLREGFKRYTEKQATEMHTGLLLPARAK